MSPDAIAIYLSGLFTAGYALIAAIFVRFWRRAAKRLFLVFAIAFALLAAGQTAVAIVGGPQESLPAVYLFRLAAFGLIALAVIGNNIANRRR